VLNASVMSVVFSVVLVLGIMYSIILHEIAHGWVARLWGDGTAMEMKRLSLNPLYHIDPLGTILVPILLYLSTGTAFGWAKPVPVNPRRFRNWRMGNLTVSLAGVLTNILIGTGLAVVGYWARFEVVYQLMFANFFLAFFNLLPIPPLDGFRVVMSLFPRAWQEAVEPYLFPIGIVVMVVLINTPVFSIVWSKVVAVLAKGLVVFYGMK